MPFEEIQPLFEELHDSLQKKNSTSFLADESPLYIYGAGNAGKDIFRLLKGRGIAVTAFLDRQAKPGLSWEETLILKPEEETISTSQRRQSHVIIGIFNRDTEIPPIVNLLKSLGYGRITTFLEFHDHFASELGDRFWLTSRNFYLDQKESVSAGYEVWSDDVSRDLYKAVLKFRFALAHEALPNPNRDDQYFPTGLPAWPNPLRLIDCGAYDGDTLRYVLDADIGMRIEAIAAFEPDPLNFSKLAESVQSRLASVTETICLFPCGVGSEAAQIRFSSGHGEGSCASDTGNIMIQCVTLDEVLPIFRPNLIKMDIEGAEYGALSGAQQTIKKNRPGLAICVYHRAEHMWTIPLLAKAWLDGGRHFLRAHAYNAFELVYYWFP